MAAETTLREITGDTVRAITKLDVGTDQHGLVAPNAVSIAEAYQGKGVGRRALELLLEEARADGASEVTLSVVPGPNSELSFYARVGFEQTGIVHGSEIELRLRLTDGS